MRKGFYTVPILAILCLLTSDAFADYGGMMGGPGMMWGGHTGGMFLFWGLYSLLCIAGVILFFWLMFRITWALEAIAKAKGEGKA